MEIYNEELPFGGSFLWSFYAALVNTRMAAVLVFRAADNKRGLNLRFLDSFEPNNYEHGSLKLALFKLVLSYLHFVSIDNES